MQFIVAIVAYLWAQSMFNALKRADRAEEIALLEQRELDRQAELEEGVRQLLEVHVRLSNGDFQARSSGLRNPLLWSVGNSLNILIARLSRTAQADLILRREQEEAKHLADAIHLARSGQQPNWPASSGAPLDIVVEALRSRPLMIGAFIPAHCWTARALEAVERKHRQSTMSMTPGVTCQSGCGLPSRQASCA